MLISFQTGFDFISNTKDDILKNVGNQKQLFPIDFHCMIKNN